MPAVTTAGSWLCGWWAGTKWFGPPPHDFCEFLYDVTNPFLIVCTKQGVRHVSYSSLFRLYLTFICFATRLHTFPLFICRKVHWAAFNLKKPNLHAVTLLATRNYGTHVTSRPYFVPGLTFEINSL